MSERITSERNMESTIRDVAGSIKATYPAKHVIAIIACTMGFYFGEQSIEQFTRGSREIGLVSGASAVLILFLGSVVEYKIVKSFGENYIRIRNSFEIFGWDPKIASLYSETACGRHAARIAAMDAGFGSEVNTLYKDRGFKWLL